MSKALQREKDLIVRLLKRKLGQIDAELEDQVRALELERVEILGEALLDFSTVEDLRNWLKHEENEQ